ncbi:MAG: O-methyltransferase [Pseudonocardiales bacterium]|nr:O-methyltransferase [Pseudonocardiales bacterium]
MTWRSKVNDLLRKSTGLELQRAGLPRDYDEDAKAVIAAVRPWSMVKNEGLNALILATRYVSEHKIPGAIVECGVWRGGSMQAAARTLLALEDAGRDLYLFDTFEGMTPPTAEDVRSDSGQSAEQMLGQSDKRELVWCVADLADVRAGMAPIGYPDEKVHYVVGKVEETVPAQAPEEIAILRLDTDWYSSTRHELEHLYPRLASGGVLLIDDFGDWEGCRKAVEEFLAETGARLLLLRVDGGRAAVKP